MSEVIWKPQPRQERALTCPAYLILYGGAAGGGKSDFLLADFLRGVPHGADHRGVLFRKSYRELEEIVLRSKDLYYAIGGEYSKSELTWTFKGGSTLKFRHLESDDDVHKYQGHQYCVQVDTPIKMGDGSVKAIKDIQIGEEVMTLEGPRKVTDTVEPYEAPCVEIDNYGRKQIHPVWHPILTSKGKWDSYNDLPGQGIQRMQIGRHEPFIRDGGKAYTHPYTGEKRLSDSSFIETEACIAPCGDKMVADITVDKVNHYISDNGFISKNSYAAFDEITNWATDYCFIYIMSRVRSAKGISCSVRLAGNPGGKGHSWVKHRFIDGKTPEKVYIDPVTKISQTFIPAKIQDNYILMKNDPEYINRLKMLPIHLQKALLDGDWDVFAGQVFEEFRREKHVIEPISLPPGWRKYCALDWGYAKPFSIGWYAVTTEGRVIRYREWYGCEYDKPNTGIKMDPKSVAQQAWLMSAGDGVDTMVADPACWISNGMQTRDGQEVTIARYFKEVGFVMVKGVNNRINGKMRFHELLKTEGWDGRPMFQVFSTCINFCRTIPILTVDPKRPEDIDTDLEDHIYDETRYAIMSDLATQVVRINDTYEDHEMDKDQDYDPLRFEL